MDTSYAVTDHDLLIALHEQMKYVRTDVKEIKESNAFTLADHEKRIRDLEDKNQQGKGMQRLINAAWGACSGIVIVAINYYLNHKT